MTWAYLTVGIVIGLIGFAALVGRFLPKTHQVSRSLKLNHPPEEVWRIITDFANASTWWPRLKKAERLPDQNGHEVWRETFGRGEVFMLETTEAVAPRRLVRRIADVNRMFSG